MPLFKNLSDISFISFVSKHSSPVMTVKNELTSCSIPNIEVGEQGVFVQSTYANIVAEGFSVMGL